MHVLQEAVTAVLPHVSVDEIRAERNLEQLGADSVDRIEILLGTTRRLGIDEPLSSFARVPDIGALVELFVRRLGA